MEKEFVPYKLALELKELGFDEPCFGSYVKLTKTQNTFFMNDVVDEIDRETPLHKSLITKAPLYQQAFRWFREKYKVRFFIQSGMSDLGEFFKVIFPDGEQRGMSYTTYEEAELACLQKLIEIVKTK
jgi:hypothetical protein